ncbi:glycosyl hydrolase family 8 [Clostridium manihotivorum]|uniref:Glycosyl hydrolase family 8 n=1 Tax=Clostridium manihotivorum TaxID=2320868 RepID=A0A410DYC6_9CLOT|nr:glycosyl hydrolase family 8 [Clostridium manihotivorum]QAA33952.1 glycosyl hydrolase family 8 [Clostridium manihotivorum]
MRKKILGISLTILVIAGILTFKNLRYIVPIHINKQWTVPKISKEEKITFDFINNNLSSQNSGIYTNYLDQPSSKDITKGHAVLSESEGLIMLYAVEKGDKALFDKHHDIVMNKMLLKSNSVGWRLEKGTLAETSATIDDFRIIKALIYGYDRWKEFKYRKDAIKLSDSILKNNMKDDIPADFKDAYGVSTSTTICYLDIDIINILKNIDRRWVKKYNEAKSLINKAYISKELPLYRTTYDNEKKQFVDQKEADTLLSLLTVTYLKSDGEDVSSTVNWIKEKMITDGALYAKYDIATGKNSTDIRSTAVYAVAAMIAKDCKDKELYDLLIKKLIEFQVVDKNNEIYGSFGNADTKEVYSFDNLNALLAMQN